MSLTLTGREILELVQLLGVDIPVPNDVDILDTEITIMTGDIYDGEEIIYKDGLIAYYTDYPEEGSVGLEEEKYV